MSNISDFTFSGVDLNFVDSNIRLSGSSQFDLSLIPFVVAQGSFGPLILNRFRNYTFSSSAYSPGVGALPANATQGQLASYGFYPLLDQVNPALEQAGNTAEGRFSEIRFFNPYQTFNTGQYFINAYVYSTNTTNDGVHVLVREVRAVGAGFVETTVTGLIDFGGSNLGSTRVYPATSIPLNPVNDYLTYKFYFAAYNALNPAFPNAATIQDTVLAFYRSV